MKLHLAPLLLASLVPVADAQIPSVTRLDVTPAGLAPDGPVAQLTISADGSHVAFVSRATNLVPTTAGALNSWNIFVREVRTGNTVQVNLATDGSEVASVARNGSISPDGRYVSFEAYGDELFPHAGAEQYQVFVKDLETGLVTLGSINNQAQPGTLSGGLLGFASCFTPHAMSAGGRYLAYHSNFENLAPPGSPNVAGAYLFDRHTDGPQLWIDNLTTASTAVLRVDRATPNGSVLVGLSVTGQGPLASTWGILDVSPPVHTHHLSIDALGRGSLPIPVGLPAGQAVFAQGIDVLAARATTSYFGVVQ